MLKRIIAITIGLSLFSPAGALEVKGLTLGEVVSTQELANIFGSANCPSAQGRAAELTSGRSYSCHVPVSYLGIKTSASVWFNRAGVAESISIKLPKEVVGQVADVLREKHGMEDRTIIPTGSGRAIAWYWDVEGGQIYLNGGGLMQDSRISYSVRAPTKLDPDDI